MPMFTAKFEWDHPLCRWGGLQVALLSQRDRTTCLSVEILQLQNIANRVA